MENYFAYFTEIEQRFQKRRGSILMLSTLDWALIETWREAGVPLSAVLSGIDDAFDKYEQRTARAKAAKTRLRKVNGLAWAAQSIMQAAEALAAAATGTILMQEVQAESGLEALRVAAYLRGNAQKLSRLEGDPSIAGRLLELAESLEHSRDQSMEDLDRILTVLEERLHARLLTESSEAELVSLRLQATRELAPYRSRMKAVQIRQLEQQFLQKRLLESRGLPRLSLFYMVLA